jgi:hypothetical protein
MAPKLKQPPNTSLETKLILDTMAVEGTKDDKHWEKI